jgi:multidrug efflux system outer membrane protein
MKPVLLLPFLLILCACAGKQVPERPTPSLPETWLRPAGEGDTLAERDWHEIYRDPVLADLIADALRHNFDLRQAVARIDEAAAAVRVQRAGRLPTVNGSAAYSRSRVGDLPPRAGAESEVFDLSGLLSYELDVWGRIRRLEDAALARYLATEEAAHVVRVGLVAGVAGGYFNLRALDRQREIAEATLASRQASLELTRIKFDDGQGIVSELDVAQAQTQVASTESTRAALRRQIALAEHALAVLVGRPPQRMPRGLTLEEQWQPQDLGVGLPSELLLRRPDLRAAERQLEAADADIGAARAALFPSLSLTAALGLQSEALDRLMETGDSTAWRVQPSLLAPIFNGGRLRAGVRAAQARRDGAVAAYQQAIYQAFREVEDALAGLRHLREQLEADEKVVGAERRRLDLASLRYEGGVASYSDVLDAQRFLFNAELNAIQTRAQLLNASVQLYKALGGGVERAAGGE